MCCQILKIFIILIRIKQLNSVFALIFLKNTINSHSKKKKKNFLFPLTERVVTFIELLSHTQALCHSLYMIMTINPCKDPGRTVGSHCTDEETGIHSGQVTKVTEMQNENQDANASKTIPFP